MVPKIIAFLGYDPFPEPVTLRGPIVAKWRVSGIARKRLASALGVDEGVLRQWEADEKLPAGELRELIDSFFSAHPASLHIQGLLERSYRIRGGVMPS